tara:strand:- start:683 stop:1024 length:342 start_codon:yes stop_codon:yes gene_type:complete
MVIRPQKTKFQVFIVENIKTISNWAVNPWRRYSLAVIIFFVGYFFGSSLGMISAVYNLMDPVGSLISVLIIELLIKIRRAVLGDNKKKFILLITDFLRIGLLYGFFTESLKLL